MAERRLVVADASPLIGLDRVGALELPPAVFGPLSAPPAVLREFGAQPDWLHFASVDHVQDEVRELREQRFGPGEAEVLAYAFDRPETVVLLDERRARVVAARRGVTVVGTVGVVLRAWDMGRLGRVRPVLEALVASGFRLSTELYDGALRYAGEA